MQRGVRGNTETGPLPGGLPPRERREQDEHHRDRGQHADDVKDELNDWPSQLHVYSMRLHGYIFDLMSRFAFRGPNALGIGGA